MSTTFIATSLALALPWAYSLRRSQFSWHTVVSILVLFHSLSSLHTLLLRSPPNVFKTLQIPLNTPTDAIQSLLLRYSDAPYLDSELQELLQRLASFEIRALYPRFGHNVLATCTYCHSFEDFVLYSLPRPVLSYVREIAFIGLVTTRRRKLAVLTLLIMALSEFYVLATVTIQVSPRGAPHAPTIWWHDSLLFARTILFLLLPLIVHFVPPFEHRIPIISRLLGLSNTPAVDATPLLFQTHQTMSHLLPALHILKYTHAATMRLPELRTRAGAWWEEEARVGTWVREDGNNHSTNEQHGDGEGGTNANTVRGVARALGMAFDEAAEGVEEGKLRTNAKKMARILILDGVKYSKQWHRH
ncbi:hypothetical protein DXG03_005923 [Asterophora parasitica]|uniref:Uncharacterized protein n=1 Tax=Asterophora parasitica TaxID=117018 RepID=A0A9P7GB63_9AGAR|nr:hypothetical protein DXG03_005923 [Asterophora parasitica]